DLERHPRNGERLGLLAAAPEHERVAALQPHDLEPFPAELDEQRVQLGLAHVLARDHERILGGLVHELGGDQDVVDERVAGPDEIEPFRRDQPRVAGAGADEPDGHESRSATTSSKKSRRSSYVAKRSFTLGRIARSSSASSACSGVTSSAICAPSLFASAGEAPPVETATAIVPSRCTAGRMKLQSSGTSATLTSIPRSSASRWTRSFTAGSAVAAITTNAPRRSDAR